MPNATSLTDLLDRLGPLLKDRGEVLVVERVARGGGQTRWYWCESISDLERTLTTLRSGSKVGFFFDGAIVHRPYSDDTEIEIWDSLSEHGDLFVGTLRDADPELDMFHLDPSDASEDMARLSKGQEVFFGAFPAISDDGDRVVTFIPPDPDGAVRPQPT